MGKHSDRFVEIDMPRARGLLQTLDFALECVKSGLESSGRREADISKIGEAYQRVKQAIRATDRRLDAGGSGFDSTLRSIDAEHGLGGTQPVTIRMPREHFELLVALPGILAQSIALDICADTLVDESNPMAKMTMPQPLGFDKNRLKDKKFSTLMNLATHTHNLNIACMMIEMANEGPNRA